jgi:hypothetical protein
MALVLNTIMGARQALAAIVPEATVVNGFQSPNRTKGRPQHSRWYKH